MKEDYDGAEPTASSVSVLNLLTLAHLVDDAQARTKVSRTLARYGPRAGRAGRVIPMMLAGLSAWHAGLSQIVLLASAEGAGGLHDVVASHYLPFAIVVPVQPGASQRRIAERLPFVAPMRPIDGPADGVCL